MGNHDWINAMGIDRFHAFSQYVHSADLASFNNDWSVRMHEFSKEGGIGQLIRDNFELVRVLGPKGSLWRTVFVHAGLKQNLVNRYGSLEEMATAANDYLKSDSLDNHLFDVALQTRDLAQGRPNPETSCKEVEWILKWWKWERIIVGHTPTATLGQADNEMMVKCGGRLILSDVAMSRWMGGSMPAALTIEINETTNQMEYIKAYYVDGVKLLETPTALLNSYGDEL